MKKASMKLLSLVLCVVLLAGCLSITAFAKDDGLVYTVLGDSNAAAYGLDAYFANCGGDHFKVCDNVRVPGSYYDIVARELGVADGDLLLHPHCGWRTTELLKYLGETACEEPNAQYIDTYKMFDLGLEMADPSALNGEETAIPAAIQRADVLTLQIGTNDVFTYGIITTFYRFAYILDRAGISDLETFEKDPVYSLEKIIKYATEDEYNGILCTLVNTIEQGISMYEENMPKLLDTIKSKMKPGATLAVLGLCNPADIRIDVFEGFDLEFLQLSDVTTYRVNEFTRSLCKEKDCEYVDIADTECFGVDGLDTEALSSGDYGTILNTTTRMLHPNEDGHAYIAKQLLFKLNSLQKAPVVSGSYSKLLKRNALSWSKIDGAYRYRVYRSTSENGKYTALGFTTGTSFYDYVTLRGTTYYYKVVAVMNWDSSVQSPYSNAVAITAK